MIFKSRNKLFLVVIFSFYVGGFYYSATVIIDNIKKYHDYPSIFTQREDDAVSTFPKIALCSYQMHSMWKLQKYYPQINTTILRAFYGSADPTLNWDKNSWDEFNKIDLDEFFRRTMPDVKIFHCLFDSLNCTHIWKQRKTKLGICLEFDLYHEVEGEHFLHLSRIDLNSSEHNLGFVIGKKIDEEIANFQG
ncbi:Oidioi.mRNA.OKI2018_I69.chr1.g1062.t1.cds [Oikopleura dioica]|uniref:Oidioi.mRNA.OKI2018_I69.chr1.g1062.t1.cds n=1 Tax=Oikopleura dioica TaxID=34765 RepID=A0ABN7ST57_OIKDI|nr:Oidioi.mRNA.OKI2018_I69.chr1.g1062.t1.cds [Oikopleura dioica]